MQIKNSDGRADGRSGSQPRGVRSSAEPDVQHWAERSRSISNRSR